MKQYLLFSGYDYYPAGGWGDFKGDFDTVAEAIQALAELSDTERDWWQIIDSVTKEEVPRNAFSERELGLIAEMDNRS